MSANDGIATALLERILGEVLELRAEVRALHRGRQGLDAGRAKANRAAQARAAYTRALVVDLAASDAQKGRPERGRAQRIAVDLAGRVSVSQVGKILRALSSVSDSPSETGGNDVDKGP